MPRRRRMESAVSANTASDQPPRQEVVLRDRALPVAERAAHAPQRRLGRLRHRRLVQRAVDLRRPPARKRPAHLRIPVPVSLQQVDPQPRRKPPPPARRTAVRNLHPDFREAPVLVGDELPGPHVRGVVHLQNHVRQRVLPDDHPSVARQLGARRIEINRLVRLHEVTLRSVLVADAHVRCADALRFRAARHPDLPDERREPRPRPLVVHRRRFPHHPGGFARRVPVLHATPLPLGSLDFGGAHPHRFAAHELQPGHRRPLAPASLRNRYRTHPVILRSPPRHRPEACPARRRGTR